MASIFKKIIKKEKKERFFCLEIGDYFLRGTLFEIIEGKINIAFFSEKNISDSSFSVDSGKKINPEEIKSFLENIKIPSNTKIIILGNPSFVFTVPAWIKIVRENNKDEITEGELENLISQAVWKFLNFFRPAAVNLLGIGESDILLAGLRNISLKVNGHKVLNPVGFKAKTVEFLIEETFVNRDYYRSLEDILSKKGKIEFISEIGVVDSEIILRSFDFDRSFLLFKFLEKSVLVLKSSFNEKFHDGISSSLIERKKNMNWDSSFLSVRLGEKLGLDKETASKLISAFSKKEVSLKVEKFIADSLLLEWSDFLKKISAKSRFEKEENIYIFEENKIPDFLFEKTDGLKMKKLDLFKLIEKFGFSLPYFPEVLKIESVFSSLSGFFEYYFANRDDHFNKMARRRAKWLIP